MGIHSLPAIAGGSQGHAAAGLVVGAAVVEQQSIDIIGIHGKGAAVDIQHAVHVAAAIVALGIDGHIGAVFQRNHVAGAHIETLEAGEVGLAAAEGQSGMAAKHLEELQTDAVDGVGGSHIQGAASLNQSVVLLSSKANAVAVGEGDVQRAAGEGDGAAVTVDALGPVRIFLAGRVRAGGAVARHLDGQRTAGGREIGLVELEAGAAGLDGGGGLVFHGEGGTVRSFAAKGDGILGGERCLVFYGHGSAAAHQGGHFHGALLTLIGAVNLGGDLRLIGKGQGALLAGQNGKAVVGGHGGDCQRAAAGDGGMDAAAEDQGVIGLVRFNRRGVQGDAVLPHQLDGEIGVGQPVVHNFTCFTQYPETEFRRLQLGVLEGQLVCGEIIADAFGQGAGCLGEIPGCVVPGADNLDAAFVRLHKVELPIQGKDGDAVRAVRLRGQCRRDDQQHQRQNKRCDDAFFHMLPPPAAPLGAKKSYASLYRCTGLFWYAACRLWEKHPVISHFPSAAAAAPAG